MKIKPKYIQRSCIEGNKIDLRQAKSILKYKPDIILFEGPKSSHDVSIIFNHYSFDKKPLKKVDEIIKKLTIAAKSEPYVASDIIVWQNIKKIWEKGINTQVYYIDAPQNLRHNSPFLAKQYSKIYRDWLFWVYLYIREVYMTKNLKNILNEYKDKKNPTICVFLQSIHWDHVKFLLTNPSKEKIWRYYFSRFKNMKSNKNIENQIKDRSKIINSYWKKAQIFY